MQVSNIFGPTTDLIFELLEGTCSNVQNVRCAFNDNGFEADDLTPGDTYFIRAASDSGPPSQAVTFDICVGTAPPPPANDECSGAIALPVHPDLNCPTTVNGTVSGATASTPFESCFNATFNDDVWFSFVATSALHNIELFNLNNFSEDLTIQLFEGNDCGGKTHLFCNNGPDECINMANLTVGNTYFIRIATHTGAYPD